MKLSDNTQITYSTIPDNNIECIQMQVDTGWRCACCFEFAQVWMIDVCLCVKHAKRYNFGYGDSLASMRKEHDGTEWKK